MAMSAKPFLELSNLQESENSISRRLGANCNLPVAAYFRDDAC